MLVALALDPAAPRAQQKSALAVVAQLTASVLPGADPAVVPADLLLSEPPLADPAIRARLRGLFTAARRAAPADLTELRWTAVVRLRLGPTGALPKDVQEDQEDRAALEAVSTPDRSATGGAVAAGAPSTGSRLARSRIKSGTWTCSSYRLVPW